LKSPLVADLNCIIPIGQSAALKLQMEERTGAGHHGQLFGHGESEIRDITAMCVIYQFP
jgi:hypothetical protein